MSNQIINIEESLEMEKARMLRNKKRNEYERTKNIIDEEILTQLCEIENFHYENNILQQQNDILHYQNNLLTFNLNNLYYKTKSTLEKGWTPVASLSPDGYLYIIETNR
jgi:hypothetical protein